MKIKLSLILALTTTLIISQPSVADDPCAAQWAEYQAALADAGGDFRDPTVQIAIRALRVCRMTNSI